ncbi:MAG: glutathione S-transferase family protein [Xanthomonadales bacterium]|jgi:glutathione S-transferase|nr:glutathione S-transferase family protein [Xanthomonadales bacterium]
MKLYTSSRAPNPRRVEIFLAEKRITGLERVEIDLSTHAHFGAEHAARNPFARVPVLELPDGRYLSESRAICTWLEAQHPEPNLMGVDATERAFIEEADRRAEYFLLIPVAMAVRHQHPGLAVLEQPQFPDFGKAQGQKLIEYLGRFDALLGRQPWLAGERYTIADITAWCALEFARLLKLKPAEMGYANLAGWRERMAARPALAA